MDRRNQDGFTLIEVILSLALFAVDVATFASTYVNVLNSMESVEVDQEFEQDMSMIRTAALLIENPQTLEEGGEVSTGNHGRATWTAEYESTAVADLFHVTLTVQLFPKASEESREVVETFYLNRPTWADPTERETLRAETRDRLVEKQMRSK